MNLKSWKLWGALVTAGTAVAVNFATEWKYNVLVWLVVLGLVLLAVWLDSKADQGGRRGGSDRARQITPVLRWEERNGAARRTVSTTSEKVATEFLKRFPPRWTRLRTPHSRSSNQS